MLQYNAINSILGINAILYMYPLNGIYVKIVMNTDIFILLQKCMMLLMMMMTL